MPRAARPSAPQPPSERRPSRRAALKAALGAAATLPLGAAGRAFAQTRPLVIGGKAFTEQYVLAEITRQVLEKNGVAAQTRLGYSTDQIRDAQLAGELDVTWDYTWTGYSFHHGLSGWKPADEVLSDVRALDAELGLVWLERSEVSNDYAFAVNLDYAAENCIHTVDDLAQAVRNGLRIRFASDQECHRREDCLLGIEREYGFEIPRDQIAVMNVAETHEALRERRADVGVVYTTDGKIPAYDLELLDDPAQIFAQYFLVPVARRDALTGEPKLRGLLERISASLDRETSQDLHYRIDVVGQPVEAVARYFVSVRGL